MPIKRKTSPLSAKLKQDEEDLRIIRGRKGERGRSFEDVLKDMKRDGLFRI